MDRISQTDLYGFAACWVSGSSDLRLAFHCRMQQHVRAVVHAFCQNVINTFGRIYRKAENLRIFLLFLWVSMWRLTESVCNKMSAAWHPTDSKVVFWHLLYTSLFWMRVFPISLICICHMYSIEGHVYQKSKRQSAACQANSTCILTKPTWLLKPLACRLLDSFLLMSDFLSCRLLIAFP